MSVTFYSMALSLGFPLILQFLGMEKEENIKHLLEVNGMKVRNYWLSTFLFFFIYLSLTTIVFFIAGKIILDDGIFQRVPLLDIAIFILLWNANQVSFSLTLAAFVNSSGTANAIGFVTSFVFNMFFVMVNQSVYPFPVRLPVVYKLFPITLLSRELIFLNLKGEDSVTPVDQADHNENIIFLCITVFIYAIIGLILNEPKVREWIKSLFGFMNQPVYEQFSEELNFMHESAKNEHSLLNSMNEDECKSHVIVCKNVKKFYHKKGEWFPALKGMNLKIEKNEVFGLLGPNGAGKTTLISIITNFLTHDTGEVLINGKPLSSSGCKEKVSLCPQFDIQWGILSIYEHVKIFGLLKGLSGEVLENEIEHVLRSVQLYQERNQTCDTLSGGMRRRCSLAMSLIGNVTIVFLDEPTTGLDPKKRREFWNLILSLLKRQ